MPQNPHLQFDHTVLEMIEGSPTGSVPRTPAYQDALTRLSAARQVYPSADHKDGFVTVRSLIQQPAIHAGNLDQLIAGKITADALESNTSVFDRYVASLPASLKPRAEGHRLAVAGKTAHHRIHAGVVAHDPVHALFLVAGTGPHTGLPGNYLYGFIFQAKADSSDWAVHLHDADDGVAIWEGASLQDALGKFQETIESAPFHMDELEALGFRMK